MNPAMRLRVPGAVLAAVVLLAAGGCGRDKESEAGLPAHGLVPGSVQLADTAGAAADTADTAAMAAAAAQEAALVAPAPETPAARTAAPRTADAARQAVPGGRYSLQLGSFRNLDNARSLAARVEALGYAPVLESVVVGGQTHHRVLLQGLADRGAASAAGERLRTELGITYLIRQSD